VLVVERQLLLAVRFITLLFTSTLLYSPVRSTNWNDSVTRTRRSNNL